MRAFGLISQKARSVPTSRVAPIGGWNARDSIADMDKNDAVSLTNWFPLPTEVMLRRGYTRYATGFPGQVETIISYAGPTSTKMFGISNGNIYDATSGGPIGAAVMSGLTNSRFQYINAETAGGNFILAVNGVDKARYYDGTSWTIDGGTYSITVADTSKWVGMTLFKQRMWAVEGNSLIAWYMPVGAIAGAASKFDLSAFFQLGGHLVSVATWTIDGGQGVDDYLCFVTSRGEVLVYGGNDPLGAFALRGLYRVGAPIGNRCFYKYQGDLLLICQDGLMPLSSALQSDRTNPEKALSYKIQFAVSEAVSNYGGNFGWNILNFPKENMLILNVPIAAGSQQQYVMNTINGAWCDWTNISANCWELYQDNPYFGGSTFIGKAWDGYSDSGSNINADSIQAFDYFGSPGTLKRFTMCRPTFRASGKPTINAAVNIDFDITSPAPPLQFSPQTTSVWDTALWDNGVWGSGYNIYKDWQGANGVGYAGAPRVTVASQGLDVRWVSTDIVIERGAIL